MTNLIGFPTRHRNADEEVEVQKAFAILVNNQKVRALDYYFAIFTLLTGVVVGVIFLSRIGF